MELTNVLMLIGGLALFLFGMNVMGEALEKKAGSRLKTLLARLTSNKFKQKSPLATTPFCIGPINIPHAVSLYYIRICRAMQVGKRQNRQKNEL